MLVSVGLVLARVRRRRCVVLSSYTPDRKVNKGPGLLVAKRFGLKVKLSESDANATSPSKAEAARQRGGTWAVDDAEGVMEEEEEEEDGPVVGPSTNIFEAEEWEGGDSDESDGFGDSALQQFKPEKLRPWR